jgi:hypothetical protein
LNIAMLCDEFPHNIIAKLIIVWKREWQIILNKESDIYSLFLII